MSSKDTVTDFRQHHPGSAQSSSLLERRCLVLCAGLACVRSNSREKIGLRAPLLATPTSTTSGFPLVLNHFSISGMMSRYASWMFEILVWATESVQAAGHTAGFPPLTLILISSLASGLTEVSLPRTCLEIFSSARATVKSFWIFVFFWKTALYHRMLGPDREPLRSAITGETKEKHTQKTTKKIRNKVVYILWSLALCHRIIGKGEIKEYCINSLWNSCNWLLLITLIKYPQSKALCIRCACHAHDF